MTTFDSYPAAHAPVARNRPRHLGPIRHHAVADLPVLTFVILAGVVLCLRALFYLPF